MKKIIIASICLIFATGVIICDHVFAQRDVNNAQEAAKAAKASLAGQPDDETAQIEWSSPVNTNEPSSNEVSIAEDGSIKIGHEDNQ